MAKKQAPPDLIFLEEIDKKTENPGRTGKE